MSEITAAAEQTASGELEFGADLETEPGQDQDKIRFQLSISQYGELLDVCRVVQTEK